jgi:hypothetical protein
MGNGGGESRVVGRGLGQAQLVGRFDQSDQVRLGLGDEAVELRDCAGDREIGQVDGDQPDPVRDPGGVQVGEVGALEVDDASVEAQGASQLPVPHVHGIDAGRSGVEQGLGEAAGGRPQVNGDPPARIDVEGVEGVCQLRRSAQSLDHAQRDGVTHGDERRRVGARKPVDEYLAGSDERIRMRQMRVTVHELGAERAQPRARSAHEEPPVERRTVKTAATGGPRDLRGVDYS